MDGRAFRGVARAARTRYLAAIDGRQALEEQAELFRRDVLCNADSVFGREHGFAALRDYDEFRRAVPIRSYEDFRGWVERAMQGEPSVLTVETPVAYMKTTGSTGPAKYIPLTATSRTRRRRSALVYWGTLLSMYPECAQRDDSIVLLHVSPRPIPAFAPSGAPIFSATEQPFGPPADRPYPFRAPWIEAVEQVTGEDSERLYFYLCYAALHDLLGISCLHPSRTQTVLWVLARSWERLVDELRHGTVLGRKLRDPAPHRADELAAIARDRGGLVPRDIWPNLKFVTAWSGSYFSVYRPLLEQDYCGGFVPQFGMSTEAGVNVTVDDDWVAQPLDLWHNLFEFVPEEREVEPHSETLTFDRLSQGATYEIVVTTSAGLYRYTLGDLYRVTGFVGSVPRLEYVGRRSTCDMTGEKLAEVHAIDGVGAVTAALGLRADNFTGCALEDRSGGARPRYVFVFEPDRHWTDRELASVAAALDDKLREVNPRYELKRGFGDIDALAAEQVGPGTFARYRAAQSRDGRPATQIKDKVLHRQGAAALAALRALGGPVK